jgi:hypothetical protein
VGLGNPFVTIRRELWNLQNGSPAQQIDRKMKCGPFLERRNQDERKLNSRFDEALYRILGLNSYVPAGNGS